MKSPYVRSAILLVPALVFLHYSLSGLSSLYKAYPELVVGAVVVAGVWQISILAAKSVWETYWRYSTKYFVPEFHKLWFKD